jgi:heterodisulfide reductase subunit B
MAKKKYTYYPGCSSQASALHLDRSLRAIAPKLDVEIEDIPDWNCCGASVGHIAGGFLPMTALSGRNLAQAEQMESKEVMTPCAACYLNTHYANEKIRGDEKIKNEINESLAAAGMKYEGSLHVRHACEVLVNDVGIDKIRGQVTNPLTGLKVAGYVGCQTVRPFANTERGGRYDTYDQPHFLDDFIEACGADALPFDNKTSCCGGSSSVMTPDKTMHLMKKILEEAKAKGADVIATPCPLCQQNVEMYQDEINKCYGTDFKIPVVFYSQIMAVAFGMDPDKDAALDQNMIPADKLKGLGKK